MPHSVYLIRSLCASFPFAARAIPHDPASGFSPSRNLANIAAPGFSRTVGNRLEARTRQVLPSIL